MKNENTKVALASFWECNEQRGLRSNQASEYKWRI